jgi:hypothetical protein
MGVDAKVGDNAAITRQILRNDYWSTDVVEQETT